MSVDDKLESAESLPTDIIYRIDYTSSKIGGGHGGWTHSYYKEDFSANDDDDARRISNEKMRLLRKKNNSYAMTGLTRVEKDGRTTKLNF